MKYTALNAVASVREDVPRRFKDANGFLHIYLRLMKTGVLRYAPENYPGAPSEAVGVDGKIAVMVEPEELGDANSLASLRGMHCIRKHDMLTPYSEKDITGSVAGDPKFVKGEDEEGYVECEAVITDAESISQLEDGTLIEVSAAYKHDIDWTPGEHNGEPYAGKQKNIRYNHFVLLPQGEGRAGPTVAVVNAKDKENDDNERAT